AIAIDLHVHLRVCDLKIAGHVLELGNHVHACFHLLRGRIESLDVRTLHRELILTLRLATADLDCRRHLHEDVHSWNAGQLWLKLLHNFVCAQPLTTWLEAHDDASLVSTRLSGSDR